MEYQPVARCRDCDETWSIPAHGDACPVCDTVPEDGGGVA